ncbi:hypothetical protein [Terribacillus saccharophilus]|uniref:hypothetical protein n=1 Tax=Terribacillus saccharophilus TaxID=361277 RepID=UPI002DC710DB|nr:hypothetical protein [Terribacillus saccharophilus]MEC0288904.1 hypothetical protein [Terribacillus saccharophilus]
MDPIHYIKNMLNIKEGGIVDTGVEIGLGAAPIIGKIYDGYRMHKLTVAMKRHNKQLDRIQEKIERKANEVFYKQEVFPLVLKKLLNEDQIEKAPIIINGFEYIVDEDIDEIHTIYHFYDVLEELRLADIRHLSIEYAPDYGFNNRYDRMERIADSMRLMLEDREGYDMQQDFISYTNNKLHRLGLLRYTKENINDKDPYSTRVAYNSTQDLSKEEWNLDKFELSNFGVRFINFFEN